ncbi:MAG: glycosyltransferase, partial [Holosporaceae bacterium]|nr:glycosyltransferase [Holosporaceae bacterium]
MKNNETLLSVITICYNQPDIEETCESIVAQTFQDFEWIVIDGGSTDGTLKKLRKYKNRINVFVSEKDEGRYHAMNKGIRYAKGKYLNFLGLSSIATA